MDDINGISIERYAELCAKMEEFLKDKEACARIAVSEGVKKDDWEAAHKQWQSKMTDPADMGKTASAFEKHWQIAIKSEKKR